MAVTDIAIENAKLAAKPYKLNDAGGVYLSVRPKVLLEPMGDIRRLSMSRHTTVVTGLTPSQRDSHTEFSGILGAVQLRFGVRRVHSLDTTRCCAQ